ncbi:hypothetical protein FTX61_17080 [Nitriliruptoraceae bacterium ZYF776]|nr:hypothetical protein [Profundirhabdus halotolerans]
MCGPREDLRRAVRPTLRPPGTAAATDRSAPVDSDAAAVPRTDVERARWRDGTAAVRRTGSLPSPPGAATGGWEAARWQRA